MLGMGAHYWDKALAQLVVKGFQQWLSGARAYYWNLWHYKRILKWRYRIDPAFTWKTSAPGGTAAHRYGTAGKRM